MDAPSSPPKRMTRSRAAAKAESLSVKTTKIMTAAARAKATRSTASSSTATTATKRKTRSDDVDDDEDEDELQGNDDAASQPAAATKNSRTTRGRAKKTADESAPEPAPAPKPRGRPKKTADPVQDEPIKAPRATRTRKTTQEDQPESVTEPVRKTTRGKALASAATQAALKTAPKKKVTFEEPEKENVAPMAPKATTKGAKGKTSVGEVVKEQGTGLRAKPVRRIASTATRATRATRATSASSSAKEPRPSPLSPKKVTQMSLNKADSEDELATSEKTPLKPMARAPTKSMMLQPVPSSTSEEGTTVIKPSELATSLLLGTPAKRMPASPWKDSMKSPARKVDILPPVPHSAARPGVQANEPHLKASLLQSPAKRPPSPVKGLEKQAAGPHELGASPIKTSLLFSPAKRPLVPVRFPTNEKEDDYDVLGTPAPKSVLLSTPLPAKKDEERLAELEEEEEEDEAEAQLVGQAEMLDASVLSRQAKFPGRLSSVLPRYADPSVDRIQLQLPEMQEESGNFNVEAEAQAEKEADAQADGEEEMDDEVGDAMVLDEPATVLYNPSPPKSTGPMYRHRDTHVDDIDSDSEDELASSSRGAPPALFDPAPSTPWLLSAHGREGGASQARSTSKRLRLDEKFGFTPLAQQLSAWKAASPLGGRGARSPSPEPTAVTEDELSADVPVSTPSRGTFFDDEMVTREMVTRDEAEELVEAETQQLEEPIFDDMPVTEEDVALAAEAHEMSLLEPEQIEQLVNNMESPGDSESEASQEYGDENEMPIDPKLLPGVPLVTPRRYIRREFHTVSKVPLKAADDSTPGPRIKKRSRSIARLPGQRPTTGLTRNATVISYSPTKDGHDDMEETRIEQRRESAPPETPSKSEAGWSTAGTPARTPRRDLKPDILRGAIVHVDVHTSEGADASGIFIELLTQMGARCVKNWPWNPCSPLLEGPSSKIGITHVVYKDGGKRTLEKVRETGGVVQCVGVSWVLDCERENQWLDESPYYIDTRMVPRGGARRRRSMEPKALANLNGMLVATPLRSASLGAGAQRECHTAPTTPANSRRARRESGLWELTPENPTISQDGEEHDGSAWDNTILTPVPKTPAPETIARYVDNVSPETPTEDDEEERIRMIMRTCPPKQSEFSELGEGMLSKEKDEGVLMRLMAARRKSLQFAPKVGSPLARAWK